MRKTISDNIFQFINAEKDNFLVYKNSTAGIMILYPNSWTIMPSHGNVSVDFSANDSRYTGLAVIVSKLQKNITLDDFVRLRLNQLNKTHFDPAMGTFQISEFKKFTTTSGYPAQQILYQHICAMAVDASTCQSLEVWIVKDSKIYGFKSDTIYLSGLNRFDEKFLETVQKLISSFKITN
jgi:hypothetical protein